MILAFCCALFLKIVSGVYQVLLLTSLMRMQHHSLRMTCLVLLWFPLKCGGGGRSVARWMLLSTRLHSTLLYKHVIGIFSPNIYVFLRIACTIPVTACENERANSVLKNFYVILWGKRGFHHAHLLQFTN